VLHLATAFLSANTLNANAIALCANAIALYTDAIVFSAAKMITYSEEIDFSCQTSDDA